MGVLYIQIKGAFQFTPPRRGRLPPQGERHIVEDFNSRPREGGDHTHIIQPHVCAISIHAPAKGATSAVRADGDRLSNFNSRPREGGDYLRPPAVPGEVDFNSRPREGGDRPAGHPHASDGRDFNSRPREGGDCGPVSIRAAAYYFNSRPREGGDPTGQRRSVATAYNFNSRPREGGDPKMEQLPARNVPNFNSRPREGGDTALAQNEAKTEKFQFTPPRRGRPGWKATWKNVKSFQFTPPRRGRPSSFGNSTISPVNFNSRPREGGDANVAPTAGKDGRFQFTPPRRGRPASYKIICRLCDISIHAPAKGATQCLR